MSAPFDTLRPVDAPEGSARAALIDDLLASGLLPQTDLELAAQLESRGITDTTARSYGAGDVFELASQLLAELRHRSPRAASPAVAAPQPASSLIASLLRGPLMFVMIATAMVGLRLYETMLRGQGAPIWATTLGLGVGMLIVGGAMPALGWRLSLALSQRTTAAIPALARLGMALGLGVAGLAGGLLVGAGMLMELPPAGLIGLGVSCAALAIWLLLSGCLIVLNHLLVPTIAPAFGLGVAWLIGQVWPNGPGLAVAVAGGYGAGLLLLGGWLAAVLRHLAHQDRQAGTYALPPIGQLIYNGFPYAAYGALTVLYVFVGPVGGWLGRLTAGWTREPAIAAINIVHLLGFATVIVSQGVTEYALRSFWRTIRTAEQQVASTDLAAIRKLVWRFVRRHLALLLACQLALSYGVAQLALRLWHQYDLVPFLGPLVPQLLFISLLSYSYLAWGLFDCSLLVALARPWLAVRALLIAGAVQIASITILDAVAGFQLAIVGSVVGAVCLILLAQRTLARLLERVDYTLYRAF